MVIGIVAGFLLLGTYYVEEVLDSKDAEVIRAMDGPEALTWLKQNKSESALASNRFPTTPDAIRFVKLLYDKGALRVIVPEDVIRNDDVEVYADALVVTLSSDPSRRDAVWRICAPEIERQGGKPAAGAAEDRVFLWWD
jgi:hypothetical protein